MDLGNFLYEKLAGNQPDNKKREFCTALGSEIEAMNQRISKLEKEVTAKPAKKPAAKK